MILGLKLLKNREKSNLVPLEYDGWLFRVISEKAAAYIIKAMSNLITSAVIVCNCAPDITPYPEAKWVNHTGLLDKISCFSIWETVTGCVPCWLLQKIYSKNFSAVWLQIFKVHSSVAIDQSKRWQQSFPQRKHHHHHQQQQHHHPKTKARMLGCHLKKKYIYISEYFRKPECEHTYGSCVHSRNEVTQREQVFQLPLLHSHE